MGGDGGGVVGFVGLDLFSFELASSLLSSGFRVQAFEVSFLFLIGWFYVKSRLIGFHNIGTKHVKICVFDLLRIFLIYLRGIQLFLTRLFLFSQHKVF